MAFLLYRCTDSAIDHTPNPETVNSKPSMITIKLCLRKAL